MIQVNFIATHYDIDTLRIYLKTLFKKIFIEEITLKLFGGHKIKLGNKLFSTFEVENHFINIVHTPGKKARVIILAKFSNINYITKL